MLADQFDERIVDGERVLVYGVDYLLTFQNNTAAGTAKVLIEGIGDYSGTIEHDFTIELNGRTLTAVAVETQPAKRIYTVGASDPAGMELELSYSNGDIEHVAYGEDTKADFTFDPALGTVFDEEGTVDIKVTYGERDAVLSVTVNKASQPDHGPDPRHPCPRVDSIRIRNPPVSPGGGNTGSGAGDAGANKPGTTLPGTGDASMLSIVVLGGLGLATAIAGVKRRDDPLAGERGLSH